MPFLAQEHVSIPNKDILSWIFDNQSFDQDKPIYVDAAQPSRSISSKQARSLVRRLVAGFRAAGLQKGDCVCIHSFNDIYYSMAFLGIVGAGGVFTGTNPSYTCFELEDAIKTAKVKFLIVQPELLKTARIAAKACNLPKSRVFVFDTVEKAVPEELESWRSLLEHGEEHWVRFDDKKTCETTDAARLFSSGTTGKPKGICMSHYNFIAQHTLVMEHKPRPYEVSRMICNPFFHVSQVPRAHTSPLRGGIVTYVMRRFELEPFLRYIEKYQITEMNLVPPMVMAIITSPLSKKYSLKCIRNAWCGAAPLDAGPQARLKALLRADAPFNQVWGMSETTAIATMLYYPEHDATGGVGKCLPNVDAKLVDDDGNDITAYDVRGELCVRGPIVVRGYFENEEADKQSFDDEGYFHTGDVAYCDGRNGLWYIVDRKKELIKVRGFQVAPPELEAVLLTHPDIVDAAVIGVKFSRDESELPRAYVVRRPGSALTEDEVKRYSSSRLAKYKNLDGGVRFVDAIPKNASGKILKKLLREQAAREVAAKL